MNFAWERLGAGVFRCRLPFLDVTAGVVQGSSGVLLIDTGTTRRSRIVVVPASAGTVVFCGDLVEESGDPSIDADSDPGAWPETLEWVLEAGGDAAIYVPGHGAVVDAHFIRRQRSWLLDRL